MLKEMETRYSVEKFLIDEADLLDRWELDQWLGLFEDECRYEIGPLGIENENPDDLAPDNVLFLVSDDHWRLEQRIDMLQKPSAHIEWPHSKTRHMVGNVKILDDDDDGVSAQSNIVVFRTKRGVTTEYMGRACYELSRRDDGFRIRSKRVNLDLDGLVPQGKVSIIL